MYNCEYCNFSTKIKQTIYNHRKSQKHILNKEKYENNIKINNISEKENILKQQEKEIKILKKKYIKIKKQKEKILIKQKISDEKIKLLQQENEKLKEDKLNIEALVKVYEKLYIKPKYKKETIPKSLKIVVWNKYFGEATGKIKCPCCNITEITQLKFHCGHIIAEKNGGTLNINNLMPICESCNKSMGTQNLHEFRKKIQEIIE